MVSFPDHAKNVASTISHNAFWNFGKLGSGLGTVSNRKLNGGLGTAMVSWGEHLELLHGLRRHV